MTWEVFLEEILPFYLIVTKDYGFSVHDIEWSNPTELQPYVNAFKLKKKMDDESNWLQGYYNYIAFSVVMSHFGASLGSGKSDAEYPNKPLFSEREEIEENQADNEFIANFEMHQRINMLKELGLPDSPK